METASWTTNEETTCPGCGQAYTNGECLECDGDGNPWDGRATIAASRGGLVKQLVAIGTLALLAAVAALTLATHDGQRILPIHDSHFTGVIAGDSYRALVIGHGAVDGWILDGNGVLE